MPTDKCHDTFECRFVCGGRLLLEEFIAMHYQVYEQLTWGWKKIRKIRIVDGRNEFICRHVMK